MTDDALATMLKDQARRVEAHIEQLRTRVDAGTDTLAQVRDEMRTLVARYNADSRGRATVDAFVAEFGTPAKLQQILRQMEAQVQANTKLRWQAAAIAAAVSVLIAGLTAASKMGVF